MSREIRHDGLGRLEIRFSFDRGLVELVRGLPDRRWNPTEKIWTTPEESIREVVELLVPHGFVADEATRSLYAACGGTVAIAATPATGNPPPSASRGRLPGLFDEPDDTVDGDTGPAATTDLTVTQLNSRVQQVLLDAFPGALWLVGEISGFDRAAHRRHVGFQLVERDQRGGATRSAVAATLFDRTRREIERTLSAAGDPFRLQDEIAVRLLVRVELYVPWGSYRVIVEGIDVDYTLGEAARRREEIVRRLAADGLLERNPSLALPALPLRVGLITSLGSDAYNDVIRTLQESGFAFCVIAHGARVQGPSTESGVLNALDALRARADELDVVLVCRGGGSRTDLAWFDSERLGRAVADFPLPVIVGIGHEQDRSVLDAVARSAKTPTAAARLLVDAVRAQLAATDELMALLLRRATRRIDDERRLAAARGRRLVLAARGSLDRAGRELLQRRRRAIGASRGLVRRGALALTQWVRAVPRAAEVRLASERAALAHRTRTLVQGAARDLGQARRTIDERAAAIAPRAGRVVLQETERIEGRARRLALSDPRRVVERGYAVIRDSEGAVLTDADRAPSGALLSAELRRGRVRMRSEGPESPERVSES